MNKFIHSALAVACITAISSAAAQTFPPVPFSPAPVVTFEYDAGGNPTKATQAPGVIGFGFANQRAYDALGWVQALTDPQSKVTQLLYNGQDQSTQVTDPRSLVTQYPRNGLGDTLQLVSPDTGTAAMTYDGAGNLKTRTDSRGVLETLTYDALNRVTSQVFGQSGQPSQTFAWMYDQTGTGFAYGVGRLTRSTHPAGAFRRTYDPQGRVASETQNVVATTGANTVPITQTVTYTRTANGDIATILFPSGAKLFVTYTAGAASAMALAKNATATPVPILDQLVFNPFAGPKGWSWRMAGGPVANDRVFDLSGRLVRHRLGAVIRDITYDAADRVAAYTHYDAVTGVPVTAQDQVFGYDANSRLTAVSFGASSWAITYDDNGNRTGVTLNGSANAYAVSATSNRLDSTSNPLTAYTHDVAGNVTASGASTMGIDLAGRMSTFTNAGVTTTYAHDSFGRRVRKFSSSGAATTVIFRHDPDGHLLGEYDQTGTAIREYVWLGDTPVAMFTPGVAGGEPNLFFIHTDHLNTPRAVVDTAGNLRWTWFAEPFGTTAPNENPAALGTFVQPLQFPGQYADTESGLNDNWFRTYDAKIGRYTQSDPIGLAGGVNSYSYTRGSPNSFIDPAGLRDVIVAVWRTNLAQGVIGHILVNEMTGKTILSQFPSGERSKNYTAEWLETIGAGSGPDYVYKIFVPDDVKFDAASKAMRERENWNWSPSDESQTNCVHSAYAAFSAAGVPVKRPWLKPLMPNDFHSGLIDLLKAKTFNAQELKSVPWKK